MNIITTVKYAFSVLKEGNQLSNVEGWKNIQLVTNLLFLAVTILTQVFPQLAVIDGEELATTINSIATTIAFLVNAYLTVSTTEKIGLKNKEEEVVITEEETEEEVKKEQPVFKQIKRTVLPKKETPKKEETLPPTGFGDKY